MRKLTYDIFTQNGTFVNNVASYELKKEAEEKGYIAKVKMVEMREKLFYDCYKGDKLIKTVTLNKDRKKAKDAGFEIKNRLEWVEV